MSVDLVQAARFLGDALGVPSNLIRTQIMLPTIQETPDAQ
jgi:hypothetical protein